jgi:putative FmdB family regulatory protein
MPIFDYECPGCGEVFEALTQTGDPPPTCPACGGHKSKKLVGAPAVHFKTDSATPRIEKRVKDYLKDGKASDAVRFADKAASMTKSDQVKRIADKLHDKTGK